MSNHVAMSGYPAIPEDEVEALDPKNWDEGEVRRVVKLFHQQT